MLRAMPDVQAARVENTLWLRGTGLDDSVWRQLAAVADGPVYRIDEAGRLTPYGRSVPTERLPELKWDALPTLLEISLPTARLIQFRFPKMQLQLIRSTEEHAPALLLTNRAEFESWALTAPEIRLQACRFAVCQPDPSSGSVIANVGDTLVAVHGNPLPVLAGRRYWITGNVAVPLGFSWTPFVDEETLNAVMTKVSGRVVLDAGTGSPEKQSVSAGDRSLPEASCIWIWHEDGNVDCIHGRDFIPASRTNVRATWPR